MPLIRFIRPHFIDLFLAFIRSNGTSVVSEEGRKVLDDKEKLEGIKKELATFKSKQASSPTTGVSHSYLLVDLD